MTRFKDSVMPQILRERKRRQQDSHARELLAASERYRELFGILLKDA
jgi:hypothetical protein